MKKKFPVILERLIKIFFIGLLVQFFLQTFVTYKLWLEGWIRQVIWLWKEIIILLFILFVWAWIWEYCKEKWWHNFYQHLRNNSIFHFCCFFLTACIISFILALFVQKVGLWTYILTVKYDLLWFLIFLLGVGLVWYTPLKDIKFDTWYQNILKYTVYWGILWWLMLYLVPWTLRLFGYSRESFEWTIWGNPPAVYYTEINRWLIRNQFLFERPISFWFFLIAFWPVFAFWYLRKQTRKYQIFWTIAFWFLILSTLSRAAMGVWLLETVIILLLVYWKYVKKIVIYWWIPALIVCLAGLWIFRWVFMRTHSNTGHIVLLEEGVKLWLSKPFAWWWAWYSWPASHQLCYNAENNPRCDKIKEINSKYEISTYWYNPENQYVQVFMEYGFLWLIPWLACFIWLIYAWLSVGKELLEELKKWKKADQKKISQLYIIFGFWLGLLWLGIEGLVLHSFVDRMIVYPFMLLYGLVRGRNQKEE